jgi:hypothetical protein
MMADEKKLGPSVTYLGNDENDKTPVTIGNVRFKPGESVNLEERLPPAEVEATLKSLAGNRFFQVDGGPDHKGQREKTAQAQKKDDEEVQKAAEEEALKAAGHEPADESQLDKPIRKKKAGEPTFE